MKKRYSILEGESGGEANVAQVAVGEDERKTAKIGHQNMDLSVHR